MAAVGQARITNSPLEDDQAILAWDQPRKTKGQGSLSLKGREKLRNIWTNSHKQQQENFTHILNIF